MERNEELTIRWDFTGSRYPLATGLQGSFESYRTSTLWVHRNSAPYDLTARNHTDEHGAFECIWRLTEPAGRRIQLTVMEFEGVDMTLSAGNGHDPSQGEPLLVIPRGTTLLSPTQGLVSSGARLWVALKNDEMYSALRRGKIVFTSRDISGKEQF